jgi:hypothetical protein
MSARPLITADCHVPAPMPSPEDRIEVSCAAGRNSPRGATNFEAGAQ